jgi:exonuclease SbcD
MKILHTADWHLGDRLGRIDRTADLRRAVERVAAYCEQEDVDVLLVAGDLFSELSRPEGLRDSVEHLQQVFLPFLLKKGTIVALTGNHDNENFCQTLRNAMALAAPEEPEPGGLVPRGRLYLAPNPTLLRLPDRDGHEVQFLLMPYPTPSRYLREEETQRYGSLEEKNRHLEAALTRKLRELQNHANFDPCRPAVLAAHIHVRGAALPNLFRMSEQESIVFGDGDLPTELAYIALGHIHQPQGLQGLDHVRYSGSIERLDLGERNDQKSVAVVDIGPEGRRGDPFILPLDATPMYDLNIHDPREELATLRERFPDADQALVRFHVRYRAGTDNLNAVLEELDRIFPRWYQREWSEAGDLRAPLTAAGAQPAKSFHDTVCDYLRAELADHPDADRDEVLRLAEALLAEEEA